jgi:hypothetical protein
VSEESYFMLWADEDGGHCEKLTREQVQKRIQEMAEGGGDRSCINAVPKNSDMNYWGESVVIIKGSVVVPQKKEVVVKYEIE